MKKLSLTLFLVAGMAFPMFAQTIESVDVSKAPDGAFKAETREYSIEGNVVKGQKDGVWYELYQNKDRMFLPKKMVSYQNGKRNGLYIEIDNTGGITQRAEYLNDQLHGSVYTWYKGGHLSEMKSYKNGVLDGKQMLCYDRGGTQEEAEYKDGKRHGVTTWYNEAGNKRMSITYSNGAFEGVQQTFYPDGALKSEKEYHNNMLNGTVKEFYEDGSLKSEAIYKDGQMKGKEKKYPEPKKEDKAIDNGDAKVKK